MWNYELYLYTLLNMLTKGPMASSLPAEDVVNCCAEKIVQTGLLDEFIRVCGDSPDPEWEMYEPLVRRLSTKISLHTCLIL